VKRRREPVRLARQAAFVAICLCTVYLPMTPLAPGADRVAPDALFCIVTAWVLRDPASAPLAIILAAGLLSDILLARPPGLGALGLVLASEVARSYREAITGINIVAEWLAVTAIFCVMWLAMLSVLRISFSDPPDLDTVIRLCIETALFYPVVSLATALGVRIFGPHAQARDAAFGNGTW
jgi:rod shape-determining protein MreD